MQSRVGLHLTLACMLRAFSRFFTLQTSGVDRRPWSSARGLRLGHEPRYAARDLARRERVPLAVSLLPGRWFVGAIRFRTLVCDDCSGQCHKRGVTLLTSLVQVLFTWQVDSDDVSEIRFVPSDPEQRTKKKRAIEWGERARFRHKVLSASGWCVVCAQSKRSLTRSPSRPS